MNKGISLHNITRENISAILPELLSLESNWTGIGESPWDRSSFEMELPQKWALSLYVSLEGRIAGYIIASMDGAIAKLNKILVDSKYRGQGIASMLWEEFLRRSKSLGASKAEFKAHVDNQDAIQFYKKKGCLSYGIGRGIDGRERHLVKYVFNTAARITHSKPTLDRSDSEAVVSAIENGDLATGRYVDKLVHEFSKFIGVKFGSATASGTAALHIALRALGVGNGDEVILPSYVCYSVLGAVQQCGAKPVFADINEEDCNISLESARSQVTGKTKAIIVPHMFGTPVRNIEEFSRIGVPIIEDCAQAVGASHKGRRLGIYGAISIFSFYATKVMTSGTGGMLLVNDFSMHKKILDLLQYDNRELAGECYNYRMNDLQASLGLSQLKKLDFLIKRRKEIAQRYSELLAESVFKIPENKDKENIFFRYVIHYENTGSIIPAIRSRGADLARPVYKPLHSYFNLPDSSFPNTAKAFQKAVSLPIYPDLNDIQIEDVSSMLLNWKHESNPVFEVGK